MRRVAPLLILMACTEEEPARALPTGTCEPQLAQPTITNSSHINEGTDIDYPTSPAGGGPHYPTWLKWAEVYGVTTPERYVHNLEHGGVVLVNPCAEGCEATSAALAEIGRALPQDTRCNAPINARWIVVRDPEVDATQVVGVAAWGHTMTSTCFNATAIREFIDAHYAMGPEQTCLQPQ